MEEGLFYDRKRVVCPGYFYFADIFPFSVLALGIANTDPLCVFIEIDGKVSGVKG